MRIALSSSVMAENFFIQRRVFALVTMLALVVLSGQELIAQAQPNNQQGQNFRALIPPGGQQQNPLFNGPNAGVNPNMANNPNGRRLGGSANADFDTLI